MDAFVAKHPASGLERFLYKESHSHNLGSGLGCKVQYSGCRIAIGKKIIDEKTLLALL